MPKTVISDTSILILFSKIERIEILNKVYGEIYTTPEVVLEFGEYIPDWIIIKSPQDKKYQSIIETQVDSREASTIALAKELDDPLLLLDDLKARILARKLNLKFTGTLGIISKAKQMGIIDLVKPILDKLSSTNFRISKKIIHELLVINNENPD